METVADGVPRLFPYDHGWSSSFMASSSTTSQLKPGLRRPHAAAYHGSPDWIRETDGSTFDPDPSSYSSSQPGIETQDRSEAPAALYPTTTITTPSPTLSISSRQPMHGGKSTPSAPNPATDRDDMQTSPDDTEGEPNNDQPYSWLIYRALRSAPGMKLPLQEIYSWFEKNTAKGKDRNSKGWQNSIRHNLSMNAGFEAVREESTPGKKAVNFWRLTEEAVKNGIQSTTRYRKQANYKKSLGSDPPAPLRQRSGAKGGKATKVTAKFRGHLSQDGIRKERCRQRLASQRRLQKSLYRQYYHHHQPPTTTVSPFHVPGPATPLTRPSIEPFDLGSVVGCADPPPCPSIFCDMAGSGSDCPAMDTGFLGWCGVLQQFPHGLLTGSEIPSDLQLGV
ncbi:hypothetical protein EYZ11_007913 [Aspergillus tanneri]|uniref:Fork-head domain-containing protein n=1 Tax=Aspergillus tanneri TaxID=1220188 RepID=A0A4S3JHC8_9EURO|nr:hypothetical protein EYZ11_007913 [Aspergillus tanneri]